MQIHINGHPYFLDCDSMVWQGLFQDNSMKAAHFQVKSGQVFQTESETEFDRMP